MALTRVDLLLSFMSAIAAVLALVLAIVVWRAQTETRINRRLAGLLLAEGVFIGSLALDSALGYADRVVGEIFLNALLCASAVFHLMFIATFDSPTARLLRKPPVTALATLIALVGGVLLPAYGLLRATSSENETDLTFGAGWLLILAASVLALGVSLDSYLRSPRGTITRRRSGIFALAFGSRDAAVFISVLGWVATEAAGMIEVRDTLPILMASGTILFIALLAYGLLSVQLFDLDLKIKWGAARGTVIVLIVIAALSAAKVVEFYLNKTLGLVVGGVAAGLTLFFAPRLNKIADRVANKALPAVQPTSGYLTFKKLEVYRAAVESAMEGGITPKDRTMLDRLQNKLGLAKEDAVAVEHELVPGGLTPPLSVA